jgi:N-acetylglucosaminyldiphosphoundecaprenol N-acetyl-beta-D-mannosaminyltransferase
VLVRGRDDLGQRGAISAAATKTSFPRVKLADVELDAATSEQTIAHILTELRAGRGGSVMTPNLDHLRQHRQDPSVRPLFQAASLVVADGKPLIWASQIQGTPLPCRVAGSELILSMTAAAATEGRSVFLLGGAPGTADRAAGILERRFPGIRVVGTYCPPFGFETDPSEVAAIEAAVLGTDPELVYVGLPFPKADRIILRLRAQAPGVWFLAVGISFSFISNDLKRAPHWMQITGLEWLHRLFSEPRRLFHRYLVQGIPFACVLFAGALARRFTQRTEANGQT